MHSNTLFKEIMKALPRWKFEDMVKKHGSDRYIKEFSSWDHLLTMVYSQISGNNSLRDVESAFNSQMRHHYHLGTGKVNNSTLSYANKNRKTEVFREAPEFLNSQLVSCARKNLREILHILDSTCIHLVPEIYPGVGKSNGRTTGVKLHVEYCSNDNSISQNTITTANINDIEEAKKFSISEGATYVFDRGYMDLAWWQEL